MNISVIGLGRAGLPLAAVIADAGLQVIGVDVNEERIKDINQGKNPIPEEPGLSELIEKHGGKKIKATSEPVSAAQESQVHIVIVPLLIDSDNNADFKYIDQAFENIAKGLKKEDIVVLETSVPVGTTEARIKDILEKSGLKAGEDFYLAYSPERIMTGYSISRFTEFPKVIGGINRLSGEKAFEIYKKFTKQPQLVSNTRAAEMIKLSEGVYRDVNIALANQLFRVCEEYGLSFTEVREYANNPFVHIHKAGVGVGGHCIPVYPWFIIKDMEAKGEKEAVALIRHSREINNQMAVYWKDRILRMMKDVKNKKILVYGLTYRPKVKDTIYSRAIALYKELEKAGADVFAYDDLLDESEIKKLGLRFARPDECGYVFKTFDLDGEVPAQ
jgi:UDP-N-acetyl-D-mannosaminuronic acid dehydrogenase